ncbi:MAG: NAD(P)H-binding protein [Thermoanaerobaculia bacterium]
MQEEAAQPSRKLRVVVAGASGFVGQALLPVLARDFDVVALARDPGRRAAGSPAGVAWRACDLFSLLDAERALEGADLAVYLVHSMLPSARLVQGSFEDLDLIAADNFGRAARAAGVARIVYLGGLLPAGEGLSRHLASRLEVEETLRASGVLLTTLRAGLVVGAGGSSFEMLVRLVKRLPAMLCPAWTLTRTQPVALSDVVATIRAALTRDEALGATLDVGGPEVLTYRGMLAETARQLGLKRLLVPLSLFSPRLSTLWVRLFTGAPRALVAPLVESLSHEMVARDRALQTALAGKAMPFRQALAVALAAGSGTTALERMRSRPSVRVVRSVQRLPLPRGWDAEGAAREYGTWLPRAFRPFLEVAVEGGTRFSFRFRPLRAPLLVLELSPERSSRSRALFYIRGGLLARPGERGRLEFREALGGRVLLAAIHDFEPRLPWPLYVATQAVLHLAVMRAFGRHLAAAASAPEGTALAADLT